MKADISPLYRDQRGKVGYLAQVELMWQGTPVRLHGWTKKKTLRGLSLERKKNIAQF